MSLTINKLNRSLFQDPRSSIKKKHAYFEEAYKTLEEDLKDLSVPNQCVLLQDVSILAKRALEFKIALDLYKRSVKLAPTNPTVYYNLGKLLYLNKQYLESIKSYFIALKMGFDANNYPAIFQHIGHSFIDSGKTKIPVDIKYRKKYRKSISGNLDTSHIDLIKEQTYAEFGFIMTRARAMGQIFYPEEVILETDTEIIEKFEREKRSYISLKDDPLSRAAIEKVKKENWIITERAFKKE